MPDWFLAGVLAIVSDWNKAESAIKYAEQVNLKVVDPAIYELRYAGRKIIEAVQCAELDQEKSKALLLDARMDCLRARHDAIDAATSKIIVDLDIGIKSLGASRVLNLFPQWGEVRQQLSNVRSKIAVSRENRNDRDALYETIQAVDLPQVIGLYETFKSHEPQLMVEAKFGRRKEVAMWICTLASLGLALYFGLTG